MPWYRRGGIAAIAAQAAANQESFSRAFKKLVGPSPSERARSFSRDRHCRLRKSSFVVFSASSGVAAISLMACSISSGGITV